MSLILEEFIVTKSSSVGKPCPAQCGSVGMGLKRSKEFLVVGSWRNHWASLSSHPSGGLISKLTICFVLTGAAAATRGEDTVLCSWPVPFLNQRPSSSRRAPLLAFSDRASSLWPLPKVPWGHFAAYSPEIWEQLLSPSASVQQLKFHTCKME